MRKMLKRVLVLAMAAAMTLSLAACGGTKKDNASYTYNVYMEASPTNWNPHTWEMNADSEIMSYIEMGLVDVQIAEDGEVIVVNRGDKGAAVINFALESNDVALATALPDGEYKDQVYGTAFVVENGILKGTAQPETTYILSR